MVTVGILHPGAMGATVGGSCAARAVWCSDGRSAATAARAARYGLDDVGDLPTLVECSDVIVSICPPGSAIAVAETVAGLGFGGVYVDANAIAPATAREIATRFERFVDGGIVGPPAERAGTTRLYLAGAEAGAVAEMWNTGPLETRVIEAGAGAASGLKMAFATWTKVSSALLLDVRALARAEGVESALLAEWAISMPETTARSERTAAGVGPKAWRFVGEMEQMVRAYADVGLPDGFARGAAELYERLAAFKDVDDVTLDAVLSELLDGSSGA